MTSRSNRAVARDAKVVSLKRMRLYRDIALTVATQAAVMVATFVLYGLIARAFGAVAVGEYTIVRRALYLLQPFILAGITVAVPRYLAMSADVARRGQIAVIGVLTVSACSLLAAALIAAASDWLAQAMFSRPDAQGLVYGFALLTIAFGLHSVTYSYYRGVRQMGAANRLDLINLCAVPIVALTLTARAGLDAMIALTALLTILATALLASDLWRTIRSSLREGASDRGLTKQLLAYGVPRIPGDLALAGLLFGGAYVVAAFVSIEAAGLFGVAQTLLMVPGSALAALAVVLLPYVSERLAAGDMTSLQMNIGLLFRALVDISIYFGLHVALFADVILRLWLGPDLIDATPLVRILMLSVPFYAVYFVFRSVLDAATHRPVTTFNLVISFTAFALSFAVLVAVGAEPSLAASWALSASLVILGGLTLVGIARIFGMPNIAGNGTRAMFVANVIIASLALAVRHVCSEAPASAWLVLEAVCAFLFVTVIIRLRRDWFLALRARLS